MTGSTALRIYLQLFNYFIPFLMKKALFICLAAAMAVTGCTNKAQEEEAQRQQAIADATREELTEAVADRDQLLTLMNEITSDMEQIKQLENILTVNNPGETPGQREQLRADIAAIQQTLQQRDRKSVV